MRRTISNVLAAALIGALLTPVAAGAGHGDPANCEGFIGGTYLLDHNQGDPQVPVVTDGFILAITDEQQGPFYLDIRELAGPHLMFSLWLYQETNGRARLQRGGRSVLPDTPATSGTERCKESTNPDTALF